MLADLVSSLVLTGTTFIYFDRGSLLDRDPFIIYSLYLAPGRVSTSSPAHFPRKHTLCFGGFCLAFVHRDVKHPVGPWGSNRTLADLNPEG